MKFKDISKMTRAPRWMVDMPWDEMEWWLEAKKSRGYKMDMDPEFQRGHVWTYDQQVAYLEFTIRGGYTGKDIYFNCPGWGADYRGPFVLVDGKQRLTAVAGFLNNKVRAFGHKFEDYTDRIPNWCAFRVHVNNLGTEADVIKWYLEMNSGGTPHTQEELERVKFLLQGSSEEQQ